MTALTAGLALLHLALSMGEPDNEIQSPLAIVVLGGLLTSLSLNLIVVPGCSYDSVWAVQTDRQRANGRNGMIAGIRDAGTRPATRLLAFSVQ